MYLAHITFVFPLYQRHSLIQEPQQNHPPLSYRVMKALHCLESVLQTFLPQNEVEVAASNFSSPCASSFKYKYSEKSPITDLANQATIKRGHEQCFL